MLVIATLLLSLAAGFVINRGTVVRPLFKISDMAGPATQSLLEGRGLTVCTDAMGTPGNPICFHAAHMPMTSLVLALGIRLLGYHFFPVAYFKMLLLLIPIEIAIYLVWRRMPSDGRRRWLMALLLLAPFIMSAFLAGVTNLMVEEGYAYSFLALATAVLFFIEEMSLPLTMMFALALDCLYLSKSSMLLAVAVLLAGYVLRQRRAWLSVIAIAVTLAAPLGWAVYQHHASGRYTLSTSLDGINLHKGNNASFLDHYPPLNGGTLDEFDQELNGGLDFADEWSFNDYHWHAALEYVRLHPGATLRGDLRKLDVLLFSVSKVGSRSEHGLELVWETVTLALFRLMLWTAIGCALYAAFRRDEERNCGLRLSSRIFLTLVVSCILPYVAGFAFTRHASMLIFPSALMCCRMLVVAPK